jgi:hypothetical protein
MELFPGLPDDVFDCHLFPLVAEQMRLNRGLEAYYRSNIHRSKLICDHAQIYPLIATTNVTKLAIADISTQYIDALILYAVHIRDIEMLKRLRINPAYRPYHISHEAIFTALEGGHDDVTKWIIYEYWNNHINVILESKKPLSSFTYKTIKPSDFIKLVSKYLNTYKAYYEYSWNPRYKKMYINYIYKLINNNDPHVIALLSSVRKEYHDSNEDIIYYAANISRRDIAISLLRSRRGDAYMEHIAMLIRWHQYKLMRRLSEQLDYTLYKYIANIMGDSEAINSLSELYRVSFIDYTVDIPLQQRIDLMTTYSNKSSSYISRNAGLAIYLDIPELLPTSEHWMLYNYRVDMVNMNSKVAKYIYENARSCLEFKFRYREHLIATNQIDKVISCGVIMSSTYEHNHSVIEYAQSLISVLKYATEDEYIYRYGVEPDWQLTFVKEHRRIVAELIVKREFIRLYPIVDSTCWVLALIYANKYNILSAFKYFSEKIKYFHDKKTLTYFQTAAAQPQSLIY